MRIGGFGVVLTNTHIVVYFNSMNILTYVFLSILIHALLSAWLATGLYGIYLRFFDSTENQKTFEEQLHSFRKTLRKWAPKSRAARLGALAALMIQGPIFVLRVQKWRRDFQKSVAWG